MIATLPRALRLFVFGLLLVGFVSRALPLLDVGGRVFKQFPTEDGYLMLTIARNIAIGNGMSTSNGTLPTNGTQPLFNFIEASGFYLFGGDKHAGVTFALSCQVLISVLAAFAMFRLVRQLLRNRPHPERAAALAAAVWFASPIVVPHSMNCLETGLYVMFVLFSTERWHSFWIARSGEKPRLLGALFVGVWLGATAWARIDAVFLIAAITATHTLLALSDGKQTLRPRILESFVMGATSVVVLSPWLIHNKLRFGAFTPISGTAQSHNSSLGSNFLDVPAKLFEFANTVLPIPGVLEKSTPALAISALTLVVYLWLLLRTFRGLDTDERALFFVGSGVSALLVGYYGFLFGAPHFVGRYLFPISPFAAAFTASLLTYGYDRFRSRTLIARGVPVLSALVFMLVVGLQVRFYRNGDTHQHFQVVEWMQAHVKDSEWVGAEQTGTLGFFHDRTVNLDGKVNPVALVHVLNNTIPEYIVNGEFGPERGRIHYIMDWYAVADWVTLEPMPGHFELVVRDEANNLGVLKRKGI